jgi:hypothetical protein
MTETASACNPAPIDVGASTKVKSASPACSTAKSGGPTSAEDVFREVWSTTSIFDSVSFDDIVESITTTTVWTGSVWSHMFEIEYKPESPINHVTFNAAALDLIDAVYNNVVYCGCSVTLSVTDDVQSSYNVDVSPGKSGKSAKCKHAYTLTKQSRSNNSKLRVQQTNHCTVAPPTTQIIRRAITTQPPPPPPPPPLPPPPPDLHLHHYHHHHHNNNHHLTTTAT